MNKKLAAALRATLAPLALALAFAATAPAFAGEGHNHDAAPADLVAAGAVALANPREVAQEAEFIIVMVPDTPQVDDVLFRADGVAAGIGKGKVVIDMSSISPTHQGLRQEDQRKRRAIPRRPGIRW